MVTARMLQVLSVADRQKLERLLWLLEQDANDLSGDDLAAAREAAGLSRGQAAKLLDIPRDGLLLVELGRRVAHPPLACRMNDVYGLAQNHE